MMTLHWDKHFKQKFQDRPEEEGQFHAKQYRRRMITSGLITLVGLLFMVYRFLPSNDVSRLWLIAVVLLLIGTILILALIDFRSVQTFISKKDVQKIYLYLRIKIFLSFNIYTYFRYRRKEQQNISG